MKKNAEIVAVFGRRGSGKSTLTRELLMRHARIVVFDPIGDYARMPGFKGCAHVGELATALNRSRGARGFKLAYTPPAGREAEALHHVAEMLWQLQRGYFEERDAREAMLVVEEMDLSFPANGLRAELGGFKRAILQGRHAGINIVGVTQRPALVSPTLRSNARRSYIFALADHVDYAAMGRQIGPEHVAELRALKPFHYLMFEDGQLTRGRTAPPRR